MEKKLFRHVAEHIKETHGDIDYIIMTGTVRYQIVDYFNIVIIATVIDNKEWKWGGMPWPWKGAAHTLYSGSLWQKGGTIQQAGCLVTGY